MLVSGSQGEANVLRAGQLDVTDSRKSRYSYAHLSAFSKLEAHNGPTFIMKLKFMQINFKSKLYFTTFDTVLCEN